MLPAVDGVAYITFLAAGIVCYSTMNSASFEGLYSAFSRMHVQRTWEAIMNAPVGLDDIVCAEIAWAATKSAFSGLAILLLIWVPGLCAFAAHAMAGAADPAHRHRLRRIRRDHDHARAQLRLLHVLLHSVHPPMVLLSGVFYPVSALPALLGRCVALPCCMPSSWRPLVYGRVPGRCRRTCWCWPRTRWWGRTWRWCWRGADY